MTPYGYLFAGLAVVAFGITVLLVYEAFSFFMHFEPITVTTRREALKYPALAAIPILAIGILIGHLFP